MFGLLRMMLCPTQMLERPAHPTRFVLSQGRASLAFVQDCICDGVLLKVRSFFSDREYLCGVDPSRSERGGGEHIHRIVP